MPERPEPARSAPAQATQPPHPPLCIPPAPAPRPRQPDRLDLPSLFRLLPPRPALDWAGERDGDLSTTNMMAKLGPFFRGVDEASSASEPLELRVRHHPGLVDALMGPLNKFMGELGLDGVNGEGRLFDSVENQARLSELLNELRVLERSRRRDLVEVSRNTWMQRSEDNLRGFEMHKGYWQQANAVLQYLEEAVEAHDPDWRRRRADGGLGLEEDRRTGGTRTQTHWAYPDLKRRWAVAQQNVFGAADLWARGPPEGDSNGGFAEESQAQSQSQSQSRSQSRSQSQKQDQDQSQSQSQSQNQGQNQGQDQSQDQDPRRTVKAKGRAKGKKGDDARDDPTYGLTELKRPALSSAMQHNFVALLYGATALPDKLARGAVGATSRSTLTMLPASTPTLSDRGTASPNLPTPRLSSTTACLSSATAPPLVPTLHSATTLPGPYTLKVWVDEEGKQCVRHNGEIYRRELSGQRSANRTTATTLGTILYQMTAECIRENMSVHCLTNGDEMVLLRREGRGDWSMSDVIARSPSAKPVLVLLAMALHDNPQRLPSDTQDRRRMLATYAAWSDAELQRKAKRKAGQDSQAGSNKRPHTSDNPPPDGSARGGGGGASGGGAGEGGGGGSGGGGEHQGGSGSGGTGAGGGKEDKGGGRNRTDASGHRHAHAAVAVNHSDDDQSDQSDHSDQDDILNRDGASAFTKAHGLQHPYVAHHPHSLLPGEGIWLAPNALFSDGQKAGQIERRIELDDTQQAFGLPQLDRMWRWAHKELESEREEEDQLGRHHGTDLKTVLDPFGPTACHLGVYVQARLDGKLSTAASRPITAKATDLANDQPVKDSVIHGDGLGKHQEREAQTVALHSPSAFPVAIASESVASPARVRIAYRLCRFILGSNSPSAGASASGGVSGSPAAIGLGLGRASTLPADSAPTSCACNPPSSRVPSDSTASTSSGAASTETAVSEQSAPSSVTAVDVDGSPGGPKSREPGLGKVHSTTQTEKIDVPLVGAKADQALMVQPEPKRETDMRPFGADGADRLSREKGKESKAELASALALAPVDLCVSTSKDLFWATDAKTCMADPARTLLPIDPTLPDNATVFITHYADMTVARRAAMWRTSVLDLLGKDQHLALPVLGWITTRPYDCPTPGSVSGFGYRYTNGSDPTTVPLHVSDPIRGGAEAQQRSSLTAPSYTLSLAVLPHSDPVNLGHALENPENKWVLRDPCRTGRSVYKLYATLHDTGILHGPACRLAQNCRVYAPPHISSSEPQHRLVDFSGSIPTPAVYRDMLCAAKRPAAVLQGDGGTGTRRGNLQATEDWSLELELARALGSILRLDPYGKVSQRWPGLLDPAGAGAGGYRAGVDEGAEHEGSVMRGETDAAGTPNAADANGTKPPRAANDGPAISDIALAALWAKDQDGWASEAWQWMREAEMAQMAWCLQFAALGIEAKLPT